MDAKTFYELFGAEEAERVAVQAGTTLDYFRQIMYGNRNPSHKLTKRLEAESGGRLTRYGLRPDIFGTATQEHQAA